MGQAVMVCRWLSVKYDALVCLVVWQSRSESVQGGLVVVVFATPLPNKCPRAVRMGGRRVMEGRRRRHRVVAASVLVLGRWASRRVRDGSLDAVSLEMGRRNEFPGVDGVVVGDTEHKQVVSAGSTPLWGLSAN